MCLLEHIYALEIIFLDLDAESTVTLRRFARENDLPALNISLSVRLTLTTLLCICFDLAQDSNALDSITDLTLSQEALLSQPGLSDVALVGEVRPSLPRCVRRLTQAGQPIAHSCAPSHPRCSLAVLSCVSRILVLRSDLVPRSSFHVANLDLAEALFTSGLKETNEALVRLKKPRIVRPAHPATVVSYVLAACVRRGVHLHRRRAGGRLVYRNRLAPYVKEFYILVPQSYHSLLVASLEYRLPGLQTIIETMVADAVDAENVADLTALGA